MKIYQKDRKQLVWSFDDDDFCCNEMKDHIINPGRRNTIQVDWHNGYVLAVGELNSVVLKYCPFCGEKIGRDKKNVIGSPGKTLKGTVDF